MIGRTSVTARWSFEGFHYWPDAPPHRAYLAALHRHLFAGTATVDVDHYDRAIEFHDLRDVCREVTPDGKNFGPMSCEAIASSVAQRILTWWPSRLVTVTISEDNENDATITVTA